MDTFFAVRFTLPLNTIDLSIKKCCAVLTGVALLRTRGYDPEADPSVAEAASLWMSVKLEKVAEASCGQTGRTARRRRRRTATRAPGSSALAVVASLCAARRTAGSPSRETDGDQRHRAPRSPRSPRLAERATLPYAPGAALRRCGDEAGRRRVPRQPRSIRRRTGSRWRAAGVGRCSTQAACAPAFPPSRPPTDSGSERACHTPAITSTARARAFWSARASPEQNARGRFVGKKARSAYPVKIREHRNGGIPARPMLPTESGGIPPRWTEVFRKEVAEATRRQIRGAA